MGGNVFVVLSSLVLAISMLVLILSDSAGEQGSSQSSSLLSLLRIYGGGVEAATVGEKGVDMSVVEEEEGLEMNKAKKTKKPTKPPMEGTKSPTLKGVGSGDYKGFKVLSAAYPAGFSFLPNGRVVYLERFNGNLKFYDEATEETKLVFTIPNIRTGGEDGALGVAVHPDYPSTPYIYTYVTRLDGGAKNQILRITINTGKDEGTGFTKIFESDKVAGQYHDGGRILFNKSDKKLYVVVGDRHHEENAQDKSTVTGKILRMNADGSAPDDNPFTNSIVYAYGIRNSFGFNFDPVNGNLWESENGPNCNDEVNLIRKGQNYGWGGKQKCPNTNQDGPEIRKPKYVWKKNLPAATGVAFSLKNNLLIGAYNWNKILQATFNGPRTEIKTLRAAYTHPSSGGKVISLENHPSTGNVYFSTSTGIYRLEKKG